MIVGCARCQYRDDCGGVDGAYDLFGCHRIPREVCLERKWTCPECDPWGFMVRSAEVRARTRSARAMAVSAELPPYIPNIHHARAWTGHLLSQYIAVPTHRLLLGAGKSYGPRVGSGSDLRRHFHVSPDAGVLLISVADDRALERYWRYGRLANVPAKLAALGITAVSVANFSFYADAHRFHLRYNRDRISACLSELSEAGIAVLPHIHALTRHDRAYWIRWLKENVNVRHICREFQTGNDAEQIEELAHIRDLVGRDLHPVVVGGASYVSELRRLFRRSTIIDSQPFFKAQFAQRAVIREGALQWEIMRYRGRSALGRLVRHNVAVYSDWIANTYDDGRQTSMHDVFERALRLGDAVRHRDAIEHDPRQTTFSYVDRAASSGAERTTQETD